MRAAGLVVLIAILTGPLQAANILVGGANGCSLANAIRSANSNSSVGNCASGSGTDFIITPDDWRVELLTALPTITSNMTIRTSTDAGQLVITSVPGESSRLLRVEGANTELTLRNVVLSEGRVGSALSAPGPALNIDRSTVRIFDSIIADNHTQDNVGAAIYIIGGELIIDSTYIAGNTTGSSSTDFNPPGYAIRAIDSFVHINRSEFYLNRAIEPLFFSGSLLMDGGELLLENSTVDEYGRGITGRNTIATIINSTFATTFDPGYDNLLLAFVNNSFLELIHVTMMEELFMSDSILSAVNSLFRSCSLSDNVNVIQSTGNAQLEPDCPGTGLSSAGLLPLANYGGPTRTRATTLNSSLIGAANQTRCQTLDQRGLARGVNCDIGAYEATGLADIAIAIDIEPAGPYISAQDVLITLEVTNDGPELASAVEVDVELQQLAIAQIMSSLCSSFPCLIDSLQPGQTVNIPIEMTLGNQSGGPFVIDASAQSTGNSVHIDLNEDDSAGNNFARIESAISVAADLAVDMQLLSTPPFANNEVIAYKAIVSNNGPDTALGTGLEFVPDNLNLISFVGCSGVSGNFCSLGSIASGSDRTVDITAQITSNQFNAQAGVSGSRLDYDLSNNTDFLNNGGAVEDADIEVSLALDTQGPYYSGQFLEFEITLESDKDASEIQLSYIFPGAELVGIEGCGFFPCVLPFPLPANSPQVLFARFFAPVRMPSGPNEFDFAVTAIPGQTDPNLGNNTAQIIRGLGYSADVFAQLNLLSEPPFYAGQEISYSLRVGNGGINGSNNVAIDLAPDNLTLVFAQGQACSTVNCLIPQLDLFNEENLTLVYEIDQAGAFDLIASAFGNEFDPTENNNVDATGNGGEALALPPRDGLFNDRFQQRDF